jgi:hypothetical protein
MPSALPLKADSTQTSPDVSNVPKAEVVFSHHAYRTTVAGITADYVGEITVGFLNGLPAEACSELSRLFRRPVSPYS